MKGNGWKERLKDLESINTPQGHNIKAIGEIICRKVMELKYGWMEVVLMEILRKESRKEWENINGQMEVILKESGKIMKSMERVNSCGVMEKVT